VIVHPRVPAAQRQALQRAMLAMKEDPDAAAVLAHSRCEGFEPADEQEYDGVRHIYRMIGQ
jgi:ABC-type phosphate/phosphonate transport system substrate-binding protein